MANSKMVKIHFENHYVALMDYGIKTATTRLEQKGTVGDRFVNGNHVYEFTFSKR